MGGVLPMLLALLAVAGLIGLAKLLGFDGTTQLNAANAARLADGLPGGFEAVAVTLDQGGTAGIMRDAAWRIAVVFPIGAHHSARLAEAHWRASLPQSGILILQGSDRDFAFDLGNEAATWLEAIARQGRGRR